MSKLFILFACLTFSFSSFADCDARWASATEYFNKGTEAFNRAMQLYSAANGASSKRDGCALARRSISAFIEAGVAFDVSHGGWKVMSGVCDESRWETITQNAAAALNSSSIANNNRHKLQMQTNSVCAGIR